MNKATCNDAKSVSPQNVIRDVMGDEEVAGNEGEGKDSDEEFWNELKEAQVPKVKCTSYKPSQKEVDDHMATHYPYRSWCEFCVMGKAKNDGHRRRADKEEDAIPKISIDYAFVGKEGNEEDGSMPILVMRDSKVRPCSQMWFRGKETMLMQYKELSRT